MELHNLTPTKGAIKKRKRIGRGQGSGKGGTSTKGHKGAQSRSGYKRRHGFEGGQMPLQRRVPKKGFTNPSRVAYKAINLSTLQQLADKAKIDTIDLATLQAHGLIGKHQLCKILAKGTPTLKTKLTVQAHAYSTGAKAAIEKLKGTITTLSQKR